MVDLVRDQQKIMRPAEIGERGERAFQRTRRLGDDAGDIALAIAMALVVLVAEVTSKTLAAKLPLAWARACASSSSRSSWS